MKVAILGITGYAGMVLTRLLLRHPGVSSVIPVSSSKSNLPLSSVDESLGKDVEVKCPDTDGMVITADEARKLNPDAVFSALPHGASAEVCDSFLGKTTIIDLSADYRLNDAALYERIYKTKHPRPELLDKSVYGLVEHNTSRIVNADIIAVPGCYPTATLLPLLPFAERGLIRGTTIINALSGTSGAGKNAKIEQIYAERSENSSAYGPGTSHRHHCEMEQEFYAFGGEGSLLFTPHLIPMRRGMIVTTVAETKKQMTQAEATDILTETYAGSPFVKVLLEALPQSRNVWGTNRCDVACRMEEGKVLLFSAIDNLMKGAAGQAVQCMNLRFGFDERTGLPIDGVV